MHQAVVEMGTNICENIQQAREEVTYLRRMLLDLASKQNLHIAAAGTHPFSDWQNQLITPDDRYDKLIDEGLTPIRRWGTPADVAKAVAAIAQDLLPFSTGEVINVDGGFHIRTL